MNRSDDNDDYNNDNDNEDIVMITLVYCVS